MQMQVMLVVDTELESTWCVIQVPILEDHTQCTGH